MDMDDIYDNPMEMEKPLTLKEKMKMFEKSGPFRLNPNAAPAVAPKPGINGVPSQQASVRPKGKAPPGAVSVFPGENTPRSPLSPVAARKQFNKELPPKRSATAKPQVRSPPNSPGFGNGAPPTSLRNSRESIFPPTKSDSADSSGEKPLAVLTGPSGCRYRTKPLGPASGPAPPKPGKLPESVDLAEFTGAGPDDDEIYDDIDPGGRPFSTVSLIPVMTEEDETKHPLPPRGNRSGAGLPPPIAITSAKDEMPRPPSELYDDVEGLSALQAPVPARSPSSRAASTGGDVYECVDDVIQK